MIWADTMMSLGLERGSGDTQFQMRDRRAELCGERGGSALTLEAPGGKVTHLCALPHTQEGKTPGSLEEPGGHLVGRWPAQEQSPRF